MIFEGFVVTVHRQQKHRLNGETLFGSEGASQFPTIRSKGLDMASEGESRYDVA